MNRYPLQFYFENPLIGRDFRQHGLFAFLNSMTFDQNKIIGR